MPANASLDIPYERQSDPLSDRMCGAAALCMVYRSFGVNCSQSEVVVKLTRPAPFGTIGARSYLLAQDALARGLSAIVLRAKDPVRTLKACHNRRLRVILNHRPRLESPNGHFTVLVDLAGEDVVVHDPLVGPNTRIQLDDLLELWQPSGGLSEITGNVLVVLAKEKQSGAPCSRCGSLIPDSITCPGCDQLIPLHPSSVLGCMSARCPERAWETLFCPHCDTATMAEPDKDFSSPRAAKPTKTGDAPGQEEDPSRRPASKPDEIDDDPRKIQSLSQEIDKFVALLLSVNSGRPVPGAETYFTTIRQLQSQLLDLQQKEAAKRRAKAAQPPPKPAPPPEPVVAKPPPRPPVDWNELARKLVEEIGRRPG